MILKNEMKLCDLFSPPLDDDHLAWISVDLPRVSKHVMKLDFERLFAYQRLLTRAGKIQSIQCIRNAKTSALTHVEDKGKELNIPRTPC